jgi:hypothetical protein
MESWNRTGVILIVPMLFGTPDGVNYFHLSDPFSPLHGREHMMKKNGFLSAFFLFIGVAIMCGPASFAQGFEKSGFLYYNCVLPSYFDFSWISDSCLNTTCVDYFLQDSSAKDLTFSFDSLRAPFGIYSFGHRTLPSFYDTLTHVVAGGPYAIPDSLYVKKIKYLSQDLYLVKTGEAGHALFSETDNFVGGCYKLNFFWALDQAGFGSVRRDVSVSPARFRVYHAGGRSIALEYVLSSSGIVTVDVYSAAGDKKMSTKYPHADAGIFTTILGMQRMPAGICFLKLRAGTRTETQRIVLCR